MSDTGTTTETGETVTGPFKDPPLTQREHMDPDKHWIGETLAPPTQTEIAATTGIVSSVGESPFAARADHVHKLDNALFPKNYNATGIAVSGTFSSETVVCMLVIPAQPVAGLVTVWSHLRLDRTVAGDGYYVRNRLTNVSGTLVCEGYFTTVAFNMVSLHFAWSTEANVLQIWTLTVLRGSGTGSAQTYAANVHNKMTALWIPV